MTPANEAPRVESVQRMLAVAIGAVAFVSSYGLIELAGELDPPARVMASLLTVTLLCIDATLSILPFIGPVGVVRATAGAAAILHTVALCTIWASAAAASPSSPSALLPWGVAVILVPVVQAVLAWGVRGGWWAFGISSATVLAIRSAMGEHTPERAVYDAFSIALGLAVLLLAAELIRSAAEFDVAAISAAATAERSAKALARSTAQNRTNALVHDEVLSVLSFAYLHEAAGDAIRAQAGRARSLLEGLASREEEPPGLTADALVGRIRAIVGDVDRQAVVRVDVGSEVRVPSEVVAAVAGAVHQALINSVRHGGPDAVRSITVAADAAGLVVDVTDDGVGFVPEHVPEDRLGLSVSILGRLSSLPGGSASVESRPGAGTVVRLAWTSRAPRGTGTTHRSRSIWQERSWARRALFLFFASSQLLLGVVVASASPVPWVHVAAATTILVGLAILAPHPARRPSKAVVIAVVALVGVLSLLLWPFTARDVEWPVEGWFLTGGAIILMLLAMRGALVAAIAGAATMLGIAAAWTAVSTGTDPGAVAVLINRPAWIVALALMLIASVSRLRSATDATWARVLTARELVVWETNLADELSRRSVDLRHRVDPLLRRLSGDGPTLSPEELQECRVVEGRLRDEARAGRLASPQTLIAAERARRRGIDVVLLDDVFDRHVDEHDLREIVVWMSAQLDHASGPTFVGRILPAGEPQIAMAATGGASLTFGDRP